MAYMVLARRYRSREFDQVIGQEPIARTLAAAIRSGRVAHAYLFCGTRGVGKTSMARIFAKALNGSGAGGGDDGGGLLPGALGQAGAEAGHAVDDAIMQGRDTDVIEIDAASNTGVDNVRELIANAAYRPLRGKYKIYIIDEVHMLSTAAFNALLKTMEEPPEHVVFILCTTETHKVPATIQSRCQRFDFRNIPTAKIVEHLSRICADEKVQAEPELLQMVARLGNGSMRDALSLLDRVMATGEKSLKARLLEELLGLPDRTLVSGLIDALASGDGGSALRATDQLLKRGLSVDVLLDTLMDRFRDLMVMRTCGPGTELVELSDAVREEETARAGRFEAASLVHMIALCENVQRAAKNSATPRTLLEALVVRLSVTEKLAELTQLAATLDRVGQAGGQGGGTPGGAAATGVPAAKKS
ncbi:MAG: DNA polymerase III subunit gamma/tau [Planctomycetota bacterium]|nr:DNA polymerase III subunit gamma/tau [Planctomycetota bacterium]